MIDTQHYRIRPIIHDDLPSILELLALCMPREAIDRRQFVERALLDPGFRREGALTAHSGSGDLVGFVLAMARDRPLEDGPDDTAVGCITLIAAAPSVRGAGLGTRLLAQAEAYLQARGCTTVAVSPYTPGYWLPGIDESAYPGTVGWLERRGYRAISRPFAMERDLPSDWHAPPQEAVRLSSLCSKGVVLEPFQPSLALPLTEFLRGHFPGDWQRVCLEAMRAIVAGTRPASSLRLALRGEACVGFAHFAGERFGPIGVAEVERGAGIGSALLYQTLEAMRDAGSRRAFFLWTDDLTAERLYRPAGFRDWRRFTIMKKPLAAPF